MRKQVWYTTGTLGACLTLAGLGARGWGQSGELPELRPPAPTTIPAPSTIPTAAPMLPARATIPAPVRPDDVPAPMKLVLPSSVPLQATPVPAPPAQDDILRSRGQLGDGLDLLLPRPEVTVTLGTTDAKPLAKQQPSVSIEWVSPETARLNHPLDCKILVSNTGPMPVHNVLVRHRLQPGVICKKSEPPAASDREDLVWTVGTLAPGQQRRLDVQLVAKQRGLLDCQATVTFSGMAGRQVQVREPLLLVKMRMPERVILGENVNLVFAVGNPGDGVAEGVRVKTTLPEGFDSPRGRVIELHLGNLAPKDTRTLQIPCVAKSAGNHKCVVAASADGNLTATDHALTDVLSAKLDLAVSGPKLRYLDRRATYQLKVVNPSSVPAQNVHLNEVVPAGFKFHSATEGGQWDEKTKTVSWQLGDLLPGQSREVAIDLVASSLGEHRLQAHATTSRGVRTEASTLTRIEGVSSLAIEVADVDDPVEVGSETAYEIRVTNAGSKLETNVELICTLPEHMELRGAKSVTGVRHRLEGREVIFEPLARLAPKADVIYRVIVRGTAAGDVRFRARVRADGMTEPVQRDEGTRFYNDR